MFTKILIANRGEIACRIIKTAQRLGIRTVAVYSDADQNSLHVRLADEAIHIGESPSSESYLKGERIISAALKTGAQAIHPGYGFLSENAEFADACSNNKVVFIGPPTAAIEAMGSKSAAKTIMQEAQVPLVPGYHGSDQSPDLIKQSADQMGYPVLLKAVAGGGGKGMRQVWSADEFEQALTEAKRESMASFGNDDMLVEKYLTQPRHVEVQVFCDQHDNAVYLFERDCSVQRRHQKIIEEAPAPNISQQLREAMGNTAVRAAQAINYQGAGTVEFLLDVDGSFYFMEMNTRLQVEHPVTEMITGQDLVEWQFRVANGEPLPLAQQQLKIHGHAFEARVYAEDPDNDFLPTTGRLNSLQTPTQDQTIRIDTGVIEGDEVSPFYDPMIAKLIVWGENRSSALAQTAKALRDYQISGVTTNLNFLYNLATSDAFLKAELDTGFIEKHQDALFKPMDLDLMSFLSQAGLYLLLRQQADGKAQHDPWDTATAWRMNQANLHHYDIQYDQSEHKISIEQLGDKFVVRCNEQQTNAHATLDDKQLVVTLDGHRQQVTVAASEAGFIIFGEHGAGEFSVLKADLGDERQTAENQGFIAPMNGTIVEVMVNTGDTVREGQAILTMEAMKMQHTINAPCKGRINELFCAVGDLVDGGSALLDFISDDAKSGPASSDET